MLDKKLLEISSLISLIITLPGCLVIIYFKWPEFFNGIWADKIQYVTIWLEFLGYALTLIEVLTPELADKIEDGIDHFSGFESLKAHTFEFFEILC